MNSKKQVFISMFGPMPDKPTGLANSVLRRAQVFAEAGTKTTILVDHFVPDIERHLRGLEASGDLRNNMISVRSLFLDLAHWSGLPETHSYESPVHTGESGWTYTQDASRSEVWRGRFNGDYREFVWMRNSQEVNFIDYLVNDGQVRINRTWFDASGHPCKIERMNQSNKSFRTDFVDASGRTYLTHHSTGDVSYVLHKRNEDRLEFRTYSELYEYWLINYALNEVTKPTIISEYGLKREALENVAKQIDAQVIYTFHSSHLAKPYDYGSDIRQDQRSFLSSIDSLSSLVVLTEEQRIDLFKQFGFLSNVHVIPHHAPVESRDVQRDPNKIVMVGRFDHDKGHLDALKAFSDIVTDFPLAKFEIYGRGADELRIQKAIEDLNLQSSVSIRGFTDDAAGVFASAAISLVPSSYEGFCLSMIESMAQGCVPIVYDFKYGPKDIITNGYDGLIVQRDNIQEMSDAIRLLLNADNYRLEISENSRLVIERFSENMLLSKWRKLMASIGSDCLS